MDKETAKNNVDYEIDEEFYKLYDLIKDEIKVVEESLG